MLKQLMLQRKIQISKDSLTKLLENETDIVKRSEELEASMEEATNEEEMAVVEQEVEKLEEERNSLLEKKSKLEGEIAALESELEEFNSKEPLITNKTNEGEERDMSKEYRKALNTFIKTKGQVREEVEPTEGIVGFKLIDGGALVPDEVLTPYRPVEDVVDLSKYVRVIPVKSASGKWPLIGKSGSRMVTVEELEANPELAKPTIIPVTYDIETYRGYIPVSQEVIDDADYDVTQLISEEINDQDLNTKNYAIASILKLATADTAEGVDGLKDIINTKLKRAYNTKLFVSASLYNELDKTKDKNGRYLLQDSITSASGKMLLGKEVIILDDDVIGETAGDLVAFIGDAYEFVALFDRKKASVKWVDNNIYGQLLAGFVRFDAVEADTNAGLYVTYTPEVEETPVG